MFFDLSIGKILVLAVIALVVFGPDQLPKMAHQAGQTLRELRKLADGATKDLREGLGPEFADFDVRDLHPANFVRKHLLDDLDGDDGIGRRGRIRGRVPGRPDGHGHAGPRGNPALRLRGHLSPPGLPKAPCSAAVSSGARRSSGGGQSQPPPASPRDRFAIPFAIPVSCCAAADSGSAEHQRDDRGRRLRAAGRRWAPGPAAARVPRSPGSARRRRPGRRPSRTPATGSPQCGQASDDMFSITPMIRWWVCTEIAPARSATSEEASWGVVTTSSSAPGHQLGHGDGHVAGARRQVHQQHVEVAPVHVGEELLHRAVQHRARARPPARCPW